MVIPEDASFVPYTGKETPGYDELLQQRAGSVKSPTNGRVFVLKFQSSSTRDFFWMQAKAQGAPNVFSKRDLMIGNVVNELINGGEPDVDELFQADFNADNDDDDDETMEDVEGTNHDHNRRPSRGTGGAGPDATGGDIREEGEESREGGADGARA